MVEGVKNFQAMRISATGLRAQRTRMDVIAENVANVSTTRAEGGGPYKRKLVVLGAREDARVGEAPIPSSTLPLASPGGESFAGGLLSSPSPEDTGVVVEAIREDETEGPRILDPGHPDADAEGFVRYPNVELAVELLTLQSAARAYEANLAVLRTAQEAARETLRIGR
jgi:flagellar basal-body rod protein FlgC